MAAYYSSPYPRRCRLGSSSVLGLVAARNPRPRAFRRRLFLGSVPSCGLAFCEYACDVKFAMGRWVAMIHYTGSKKEKGDRRINKQKPTNNKNKATKPTSSNSSPPSPTSATLHPPTQLPAWTRHVCYQASLTMRDGASTAPRPVSQNHCWKLHVPVSDLSLDQCIGLDEHMCLRTDGKTSNHSETSLPRIRHFSLPLGSTEAWVAFSSGSCKTRQAKESQATTCRF